MVKQRYTFNLVTAAKEPLPRAPLDVYGIPNSGPSEFGSTIHKQLLSCPREYALYQRGIRTSKPHQALDTGILIHHALQVYYEHVRMHQLSHPGRADDYFYFGAHQEAGSLALSEIERVAGAEGYGEIYDDANRMMAAYLDNYWKRDRWDIVAVESGLKWRGEALPEGHPLRFNYSSRVDAVAIFDDQTWIVEHKSARSITNDLIDHYEMDLQVLGHKWLWNHCVDTSQYPPFGGVLINLITKQKEPRCVRVPVNPSYQHLAAFEQTMRGMPARKAFYASQGWPRSLGHCAGYARGYTNCQYYGLCHNYPEITPEQWDEYELPEPFARVEENTP